jgi:protoheme IX farnesyltransferase
VAPVVAWILAALLWLGGAGLLAGGIGPGTGAAALVMAVGYVDYVVVYSLHAKRRSVHGTLVGSVAGAAAPVAGYALGAGELDLGALPVFLLFACWQMPHAYAIAVGRMDDYAAAGIPVLPRLRGMAVTRRWSLFYLVAFFLLGVVASAQSSAPALSGAAVGLVGGHWLFTALRPIEADPQAWARGVFRGSLWTVLALALAWSAAPWMAWLGGGG